MVMKIQTTFFKYNIYNQTGANASSISVIPKNTGITKDVVSFSSANVDKEDAYNLRNLPGLTCACCGKKMINEADYRRLKTKDFQGPAYPVLKKLKPFVPFMKPTEKTVYNLLKRASSKDPNADLNTLLRKRYYYHLGRLEVKQLGIINKAISQKLELSSESQAELDKTMQKVREILFIEPKHSRQKRERVINEFVKLKQICPEKNEIDKIIKVVQTLPNSKDDVDSFIIKYTQRGNREIGQRLLSPSLPTLDHIKPASKSGHDDFSNLIVMCEKCNSARGSIHYQEWFKIHPEMPENIQKNINKIIKAINTKKLQNFDTYPLDIKETLEKETNGQIILNIDDYQAPVRELMVLDDLDSASSTINFGV